MNRKATTAAQTAAEYRDRYVAALTDGSLMQVECLARVPAELELAA